MKKFILFIAILFVGTANAGLIGDTVNIELSNGGNSYGVNNHLVAAGEEGSFFGNQFYDFDDFSFDIRSNSTFCGMSCSGQLITLALTDLNFGDSLTNVVFNTSLTGVSLDFGSDFVSFSWLDQSLPADTYLSATFETASVSVSEPSLIGLLGLALAGIGFSRKRKNA